MQTPTWLKPSITGAIIGGIATMVLGFNVGGWYLGSSAEQLAQHKSNAAVIDALVPICVGNQQMDPEAIAKLRVLVALKSSYEQRDYVMKAGWATMPPTGAPNRDLATACATVLSKVVGS